MPKNKKIKQDSSPSVGSFSKNLLGLKFMQRAKKEVEKVAEDEDDFDLNLCKNVNNKQQYILNQSYQFCERLKFGRLSFKGMNLDIESMCNNTKEIVTAEKRPAPPSESSSDNEIDDD